MKIVERGTIIYVDLGRYINSSIQSGIRPCVVVSNNKNNRCSKVLSVCPCTTKVSKKKHPMHILLEKNKVEGRFQKDSLILIEQITTIDKSQVISIIGKISSKSKVMSSIDKALELQLGLGNNCECGNC